MSKTIFIAGVASVASLAVGLTVGYKLAVHRLSEEYDELMQDELEKTRAYYERNAKPFPTPAAAVKVLHPEVVDEIKSKAAEVAVNMPDEEVPVEVLQRVVDGLKYNKITPAAPLVQRMPPVEIKEEVVTSIFNRNTIDPEDDAQYQEMVDNREHETIYLVTQEEHMENPHEFQSITFTYYEGDSVLVDESDQPVGQIERAIGDKDNLQFGRWSGDANVVYIRNEALGAEIEILRSTGKYSVEVLGLDPV